MRILGIDPGTAICGYGIIDKQNYRFTAVDYGVIRTPKEMEPEKRLATIYEGIITLIETYQPDEVCVEELFFHSNARTVIPVGQARGVILLAAAHRDIPLFEYTPLQVKQAVVGYGRADKKQVQYMIKTLLNLKEVPKPDDAADALAIAVCHGQSQKVYREEKST